MLSLDSGPLRFGLYELNPLSGELRRRGLSVRLTPQAMTLLCLLVEPPIRMRTREEIQRRLWPGNTFVDFERSLNKAVHSLREGLGDSATNPRFVETVAAQGYRFLPTFMEGSGWEGETRFRDGLEYVAVLPIVSGIAFGVDEELVFVGNRITSCLTDGLSAIRGVRVMAESTVRSGRLDGASPQGVGKSLGVQTILAGDLTRHGALLHLRMELIDVANGVQIRGAHAEGIPQNGVLCEVELAEAILRQIVPVLVRVSSKMRVVRETGLVMDHKMTVG
jgi:DNA-binding winged helix-turn-helix (wHTH) protein/TolB-like protein